MGFEAELSAFSEGNVWYLSYRTKSKRVRNKLGKSKKLADLARKEVEVRIAKNELGQVKRGKGVSKELTAFQKRILRFLKEETAKSDSSACYLDAFFERLSSNQTTRGKGFFLKELSNLENEGFIETTRSGYTKRKGMKFNCYKITEKGLGAIEEN